MLFYSSSEIYGDPTPENIPTPETYRGNVSCTGPRACYDESKRYGETLCVNFARQHGVPIKVARPFNNYGPGLKITDGRVIPDFARDILAGRDIVMLSDGSAQRTFCYVADAVAGYYKILVKGRPGEAYNVGVETPEISMAELAGTHGGPGTRAVRLQGQCRAPGRARTRTTWSTIPTVAAQSSPRRAPSSATTRRCRSTRDCGARLSGTRATARHRRRDETLHHRNRICRARHRRLPGGERAPGHLRRHRSRRVAALNRGESPIFEAGLDDLLRRHVGTQPHARPPISHAAVLESDVTLIAVGTPFDGQRHRSDRGSRALQADRRGAQQKAGYHVVVVKSTVVPGTTDSTSLPALEEASGKKAGVDFGVGMNPEFLSEGEAVHDFMFPDRIVLGGIDERTIEMLESALPSVRRMPRASATNTGPRR